MCRWPVISPRVISKIPCLLFLLALCALCSCTTAPSRSGLPADVRMNYGAGRGDWLVVMVRLGNGERLPFVVDTSSPITTFDRSLIPELSDPVAFTSFLDDQGNHHILPIYYVLPMYLGNTRLQTGAHVVTRDFRGFPKVGGHQIKGVLGLDVLTNYCIQLDFKKRKIRFLNDTTPDPNWGRPFSLLNFRGRVVYICPNLVGSYKFGSLINTGDKEDGCLRPELFQSWTNPIPLDAAVKVSAPNGRLDGDLYVGLNLREQIVKTNNYKTWFNEIGLHALAHDVVTFDFPKQTMYLKHVNELPAYTQHIKSEGLAAANSASLDMNYLKIGGRLPGWPKDQVVRHTSYYFFHYAIPYCDQLTWNLEKERDPSIYHYLMVRTSPNGPWKLQRAWRSDQNMLLLEEYPLPKGN